MGDVNDLAPSDEPTTDAGVARATRAAYEVVWPHAPMGVQRRPHAVRLADLRGRRIAFVWEYMFRGDELFPALEQHLRDHHDVEVIGYEAFGNTHGPDEAEVLADLPQKLRNWRVDAAISGVGC